MYISVQQCEQCVCVFTNKYTEGQAQKVLLWGEWTQRFGDHYLNMDDFGCLPLKDIYKTNIHYFVHFIFIKWKPYATNPFEKLGGSSRVKGTGWGPALCSQLPPPHFPSLASVATAPELEPVNEGNVTSVTPAPVFPINNPSLQIACVLDLWAWILYGGTNATTETTSDVPDTL